MNTVRRAEIGDIPAILELLVQVDMVHHNGRPDLFRGPATKYNAEELKEIIANEKTPVFVCVNDEGKVLGHLFGMFKQELNDSVQTDIKTLYIDDICVDEAARGQGVGRTLYDFIKGFAKKEGCYNITLNVWCCNPDAMKFYENMGLVPQKIGMEHILN
ncbi:Ribosomal protein S18 acetylase RimI [Lachnospiraceae bacterium NE2001]|nr:Ribosomal protein S18 acetylase RimI [Lachnospiraceae bacterium NE2001]